MKKSNPAALGLAIAVAFSTGTALTEHPPSTDQTPGASSDITIAEADNQKLPPPGGMDEGLPPPHTPSSQATTPPVQGGEVVGEGQKNKGVPPAAVNPPSPSEVR